MQGSAARIADTAQRGAKMKRKMDRRQNSDFETRISESVRWQRTENTGQRGQISVFKRNRFISSCRISICRSGCKRLRTFSRRSGSIAARSRTSLSRVLYLEYLLKPMPTAMRAEIVQTVMSVPVITRRLQIENYRLESRKTDQSDGDSTSDADCVFLFANRNDAREASASVLPALGCYLDRSRCRGRAVARLRRWTTKEIPPQL